MFIAFENIKIGELETFFTSEEKCLKFIAEEKWKDGYVCKKCGHTNYCSGSKPYSRRCTKCKTDESATSNTIFHRCRIPITKAFKLAHLVCNDNEISIVKLANELETRPMTCWSFKKKITQCIDSREDVSQSKKIELKEIILGIK
jgi:hypothetical protein